MSFLDARRGSIALEPDRLPRTRLETASNIWNLRWRGRVDISCLESAQVGALAFGIAGAMGGASGPGGVFLLYVLSCVLAVTLLGTLSIIFTIILDLTGRAVEKARGESELEKSDKLSVSAIGKLKLAAKAAKRRASVAARRGSAFMMENPMNRRPKPPPPFEDDGVGAIELGDIYAGGDPSAFAAQNPMARHRAPP